jgi:hypothetical protein
MRILAISFVALNLLLLISAPAIRSSVDEQMGRSGNPANPEIWMGLQELLVYFDFWLSYGLFPAVYTVGFAAIPFLLKSRDHQVQDNREWVKNAIVASVLVVLELVWLGLFAVMIFLRGPNWNIFWPGEEFTEDKIVSHNTIDLDQYVWMSIDYWDDGMPWICREAPGLILLGSYFLAGLTFAFICRQQGFFKASLWRSTLAVILLQLAMLVPLKVVSYQILSIKYWITTADFVCNI